jgi:hypothetical protein
MKSRKIGWTGHIARIGEKRDTYKILVGKPEGKRPFGRLRRSCEYNIRIGIRKVGSEVVD